MNICTEELDKQATEEKDKFSSDPLPRTGFLA
jgi:hypothetical protein